MFHEIDRAFSLTKAMYYEIIGRKLPKVLGYRRRSQPSRFMDIASLNGAKPVPAPRGRSVWTTLPGSFHLWKAGLDFSCGKNLRCEIVSAPGGRGSTVHL